MSRPIAGRPATMLLGIGAMAVTSCTGAAAGGWSGDCPAEADSSTRFMAFVELSASERSEGVLDARLRLLEQHAGEAADCDATIEVVLLDSGRADVVVSRVFTSTGTEVARDRQVDAKANELVAAVAVELEDVLEDRPVPGQSDPGSAFRVLDDRLARLDPATTIRVLMLSDGVTTTAAVDLNRSLGEDELDELAAVVAPTVDLDGRVHLDWPLVGRTADPIGPPGTWLDRLVELWRLVCRQRGAQCVVTSS